jgi:hypothetical protein
MEGASLGYKLKQFRWELIYAWQRAYRGYDYKDVCDLNINFINRLIPMLKDFKENNIAIWEYEDENGNVVELSEEETNKIIDEIIYHFENSDENKLTTEKYGDDWKDVNAEQLMEMLKTLINQHDKQNQL